jgi:hypothetical protein
LCPRPGHFLTLQQYNPINNTPVDNNTILTVKASGWKLLGWDIYVVIIAIPITDSIIPANNKIFIFKYNNYAVMF